MTTEPGAGSASMQHWVPGPLHFPHTLLFFWDITLLYHPSWPWTSSVAQAGLKFAILLQVCTNSLHKPLLCKLNCCSTTYLFHSFSQSVIVFPMLNLQMCSDFIFSIVHSFLPCMEDLTLLSKLLLSLWTPNSNKCPVLSTSCSFLNFYGYPLFSKHCLLQQIPKTLLTFYGFPAVFLLPSLSLWT